VYSYQGLKGKKFKSKLEWLLVRKVVGASSITKVSCRRTELKRCSDAERRWNRNDDARSSPEKLLSIVTEITQELQSW